MSQDKLRRKVATLSLLGYTGLSLAAALAFFLVTTFSGNYNAVARYGGAVWVFLLCLIISMPLVTQLVKKRVRG